MKKKVQFALIFAVIAIGFYFHLATRFHTSKAVSPTKPQTLVERTSASIPTANNQKIPMHSQATPAPMTAPTAFPLARPSGKGMRDLLPAKIKSKRIDPKANFKTGQILENSAGRFEILNLKALPKKDFNPEFGHLIEEKMGFVVFEPVTPSSKLIEGFPVVQKKSNGLIGIVSGVFITQLSSLDHVSILQSRYPLKVKTTDPDLLIAYLQAPENSDLHGILESLKKDPLVQEVQLEIITSLKRP